MLFFCPNCANALYMEKQGECLVFLCHTCPYLYKVTKTIASRNYPKLKQVDDILGGKAAWENVDSTEATCPKCDHNQAFFMQIQTRSADEPMTVFYKCCSCGHRWKD
ncbi:DNA-directed RNA polymerase III subunit RPC10 [Trichoplax sp. H2]|uniref:DNA-directed RNA polymerase subunit n=1 Tax=Trichoplax adhaerens TaxID=10228 RepID=B3S471_TRIAD|nr:hypothetical protein TRIADDRAFT_28961 [Trichoplax adhaerens]EDV22404.1 hypothetical protein TRIADDRAFT_28961 [Trichoplax adhaerens]RDD42110.1 DNA-directed RNA polymerase III subunit RPC10 [Trichoplax sp. H2]|eukprot:XP_002114948.1 hypothetical protein TRIADDRAFT_28961 [Trichoplax adhaerens]